MLIREEKKRTLLLKLSPAQLPGKTNLILAVALRYQNLEKLFFVVNVDVLKDTKSRNLKKAKRHAHIVARR